VPTLSLDVPSGVDATTGDRPGVAVEADRTLTLALPKTGLRDRPGDLLLGDLGIPAVVYEEARMPYSHPFGGGFVVGLVTSGEELIWCSPPMGTYERGGRRPLVSERRA
jgi:NAD(P)H-hydrate epimerase